MQISCTIKDDVCYLVATKELNYDGWNRIKNCFKYTKKVTVTNIKFMKLTDGKKIDTEEILIKSKFDHSTEDICNIMQTTLAEKKISDITCLIKNNECYLRATKNLNYDQWRSIEKEIKNSCDKPYALLPKLNFLAPSNTNITSNNALNDTLNFDVTCEELLKSFAGDKDPEIIGLLKMPHGI